MRYTPFESMDRLFEQMRREMSDLQSGVSDLQPSGTLDRDLGMDLTEHDEEFVFTADLPGYDREEISLRFVDGTLHLSATNEADDETTSRRRSVTERVSIPGEVDVENITASYHNGVLEVHLPISDWADVGTEIDVE